MLDKNNYPANKEFIQVFKRLSYAHHTVDVWHDFVLMFACAISNAVDKSHREERERMYLNTIKRYSKREQQLFPELAAITISALEGNPEQDFLGSLFMQVDGGNPDAGQYFTPYDVCELMAVITTGDMVRQAQEQGVVTMHDPCCGAGALLLAGINRARKELEKEKLNFQHHMLVVGQDIDPTAAMMCYIQISLLGVAGFVKVGNSLTEPICEKDDLSKYWFTPMYFSGIWTARRFLRKEGHKK